MPRIISWLSSTPLVRELVTVRKSALGRSRGKIVVRHRRSAVFKKIYLVDRFRLLWNLSGIVISLEKTHQRRPYVALIAYSLGILAYVPAVAGQAIGSIVTSGWNVRASLGNSLPLANVPLNIKINNLESYPGSGSVYVRSPGNWAIIIAKNPYFAKVGFKNGQIKFLPLGCFATIGRVSNVHQSIIKLKKAGQTAMSGWRPRVRGVAKNPVDHPHGGGKGKKSKNSVPEAPWGRLGARKKKNVKKLF